MRRNAAVIRYAYRRGYRVLPDGSVMGPKGLRKLHLTPTGRTMYYKFTIRYRGKYVQIRVHQLAGYQVFGAASQRPGILVCHINHDSTCNRLDNFKLGNESVNARDRHRHRTSILALSDIEYTTRAARADAFIREITS